MRAAARILWIASSAALAGAALAQTTTGSTAIGSTATGTLAPGQVRGLGLPDVPNNSLPPVTTPSTGLTTPTPITGSVTPGIPTTTPGIPTTTPGISTTNPVGFGSSATGSSATTGSFINLPPPVVNAPSTVTPIRTCPSGMTFC